MKNRNDRGSCMLIVLIVAVVLVVAGFFVYRNYFSGTKQGDWIKISENGADGSGPDLQYEIRVERSYFYTINRNYYLSVEWIVKNTGTVPRRFDWKDKHLQVYFNPRNVPLGSPDSTTHPPTTGGDSGILPPGGVSKIVKTDYTLGKAYFESDFFERIFWGVIDKKGEALIFKIRLIPENKASNTPQFIAPDSGGN